MGSWQLYLANVNWLARDKVESIIPGKLPVPTIPGSNSDWYEASIPAYAREAGREMQLAIKSLTPCYIIDTQNNEVPMFLVVHADTGDHWWIEKGPWEHRPHSRYHDAPSFHRPGGSVTVRIGQDRCKISLYNPSLSTSEFTILLDDIKNWCWRMAIDESCYVVVEQDSEVRVLTPKFLQLAEDFLRHTSTLLELPHSELRESVEDQREDRLRPNTHSLRFIAQRGHRRQIPGRATAQHYNTPENRFVFAMLKRLLRILRLTAETAKDSGNRYISTAIHYENRAKELQTQTSVNIDPYTFHENLRRLQEVLILIQNLPQGYQVLDIETGRTNYGDHWGSCDGERCSVLLGAGPETDRIRTYMARHGAARVYGSVDVEYRQTQTGKMWPLCRINQIHLLASPRKYEEEYQALERDRQELETHNWEKPLRADVITEQKNESKVLLERATTLRKAAKTTLGDSNAVNSLLSKAVAVGRRFNKLGVTSDIKFVPTMVFLQSPSYSGALSSYRQLIDLAGIDEPALEGLLALEEVGFRDWPGVYERWCLVSLLRVLQDDFRFIFDKAHVRDSLLKYCTGQEPKYFAAAARRDDMSLELSLEYQKRLRNGKIPDFVLEIRQIQGAIDPTAATITCVLDAKACDFRARPPNAESIPTIYLDDSLHVLIHDKNYGENGTNLVYILHASKNCITQPTTLQPWARSSAYGGDIVFAWETEMPVHNHGGIQLRPGDTTNLKRLVLMLIQYGLQRYDICPSCGSGGDEVEALAGRGVGTYHRCKKCGFLTVRSHCYSCKKSIAKNQAWWTYHDLHPTEMWNIKCCSCGAILSPR